MTFENYDGVDRQERERNNPGRRRFQYPPRKRRRSLSLEIIITMPL